tara:strand:- start:1443 stop:1832 length:390 start_codon:yes stop_codon:yes gene_type:complete
LKKNKIKTSSNKSFGIVFSIVFIIIFIYPLLKYGVIRYWPLIISLVFLILGFLKPNLLTPLNKVWTKFGMLLGNLISPIIMGIIFFLVVTPIALIMRILGKDLLNLRKSNHDTYWIKKNNLKSSMQNQF